MKRITFLLLMLCFGLYTTKAQQLQVPNGNFESWTGSSPDSPANWLTKFTVFSTVNFVNKSTTFQEGQFALEVYSQSFSPIPGGLAYNIPGIATLGRIELDPQTETVKITGGAPFSAKPSKLKGWFQYMPQGSDSAIIYSILTKWNAEIGKRDTIADGVFTNSSPQSAYAQFVIDYTYRNSTLTPDSLNIVLLSSGLSATPGSKLLADNLVFEYPQGVFSNERMECYIYPNPSNGILNVSLANNVKTTLTLLNSLGQVVLTKVISGASNSFDFSSLPKGVYLLDLRANDQRVVKKITLK